MLLPALLFGMAWALANGPPETRLTARNRTVRACCPGCGGSHCTLGLSLQWQGDWLVLSGGLGVIVRLDRSSSVSVSVDSELQGQTQGLCGVYNGQPEDDFLEPGGRLAVLAATFGNSWRLPDSEVQGLCGTFTWNQQDDFLTPAGDVETSTAAFASKFQVAGEGSCPADDSAPLSPCGTHTQRHVFAETACAVLHGPTFQECQALVDREPFHLRCLAAVSGCAPGKDCLCPVLTAFARPRAQEGARSPWRTRTLCPVPCPGGQEYQECVPACGRNCGEPEDCGELGSCVAGCNCPPGLLWDPKGECVPPNLCSCRLGTHRYAPGSATMKDCNRCVCQERGLWNCSAHRCGPQQTFCPRDLVYVPGACLLTCDSPGANHSCPPDSPGAVSVPQAPCCCCDSGGDCECLCLAIATYADECARRGLPVRWHSQELCLLPSVTPGGVCLEPASCPCESGGSFFLLGTVLQKDCGNWFVTGPELGPSPEEQGCGAWGTWNSWGPCSRTWGPGVQGRSRHCSPPGLPMLQHCPGPKHQTQACFTAACPVGGEWTFWSPWSPCAEPCMGTMTRQRQCHPPQNGGRTCAMLPGGPPTTRQTRPCPQDGCPSATCSGQLVFWPCAPCPLTCAEISGQAVCAANQTCSGPVNCGWSSWSPWAECLGPCGSQNIQWSFRSPNNPHLSGEGRQCRGIHRKARRPLLFPAGPGLTPWGSLKLEPPTQAALLGAPTKGPGYPGRSTQRHTRPPYLLLDLLLPQNLTGIMVQGAGSSALLQFSSDGLHWHNYTDILPGILPPAKLSPRNREDGAPTVQTFGQMVQAQHVRVWPQVRRGHANRSISLQVELLGCEPGGGHRCAGGEWAPRGEPCEGLKDCEDGSDEEGCVPLPAATDRVWSTARTPVLSSTQPGQLPPQPTEALAEAEHWHPSRGSSIPPTGKGPATQALASEPPHLSPGESVQTVTTTPISQVTPVAPAVDCGLTPWSGWSLCSRTCGPGLAFQRRDLLWPPLPGGNCPSDRLRSQPCFMQTCPGPGGEWGPWSPCSVPCGGGYQNRIQGGSLNDPMEFSAYGQQPCAVTDCTAIEGAEYSLCGPACPRSCDDLMHCVWRCQPGCYCPPGQVLSADGAFCVPPGHCGCLDLLSGERHRPGLGCPGPRLQLLYPGPGRSGPPGLNALSPVEVEARFAPGSAWPRPLTAAGPLPGPWHPDPALWMAALPGAAGGLLLGPVGALFQQLWPRPGLPLWVLPVPTGRSRPHLQWHLPPPGHPGLLPRALPRTVLEERWSQHPAGRSPTLAPWLASEQHRHRLCLDPETGRPWAGDPDLCTAPLSQQRLCPDRGPAKTYAMESLGALEPLPGCRCPPGQLIQDGHCVPISSCCCGLPSPNASWVVAPAEVAQLDCKNCTCINGSLMCPHHECPVLGPWSAWSSCSAPCGGGTMERHRSCEEGPVGVPCQARDTEQWQECNLQACPVSGRSFQGGGRSVEKPNQQRDGDRGGEEDVPHSPQPGSEWQEDCDSCRCVRGRSVSPSAAPPLTCAQSPLMLAFSLCRAPTSCIHLLLPTEEQSASCWHLTELRNLTKGPCYLDQ
ncbi:hypothetical protein GH733_013623, partial [Mirounga leonina]